MQHLVALLKSARKMVPGSVPRVSAGLPWSSPEKVFVGVYINPTLGMTFQATVTLKGKLLILKP